MIGADNLPKSRIVVDTDVFSYIFRDDPRAGYYKPHFLHRTLALSFMTVGQLYYGAYKDRWGESKIARLENEMRNYVVLPYDHLLCREWAQIRAECSFKGLSIEQSDAWIAACARYYGCAIATNNGRHFRRVEGLTVICPGFETSD